MPVSGVFSEGFQIVASPQTAASARMPLLHEPVRGPLARDREAVQLARETDGEVADVDHLLHFSLAFGEDLAGLEGYEPAELAAMQAQRLAVPPHELAALRRRHVPPLEKCLLRGADDACYVRLRGGRYAREHATVDRRDLLHTRARAEPFAGKDAGVVRRETQPRENFGSSLLHRRGVCLPAHRCNDSPPP